MALVSLAVAAEPDRVSRPATKEDLVGAWELVSVRPVYDKTDPVFYPYQRFVFNKDSSMKFMVSEKPFTQDWLTKFTKQMPEIDYTISDKGLLTLSWQTRPHNESVVCAYVLKDVPADLAAKVPAPQRSRLPKKGNLTLSYLNNSGKIAYQKILTRIV